MERSTAMDGFFGKKQYAAKAASVLTTKFSTLLCLECSTWAMFFNSSLTVSMMALFLSRSLSEMLIKDPFMLFFSLVINCIRSSVWLSVVSRPQRDAETNPCRYILCHRQVCHRALPRIPCSPVASCRQHHLV